MKYFLYLNFDELDNCVGESKYIKLYFSQEICGGVGYPYICSARRIYQMSSSRDLDLVDNLKRTYLIYSTMDLKTRTKEYFLGDNNKLFIISQKDELDLLSKSFPEHLLITCSFNLFDIDKSLEKISDYVINFNINTSSVHREVTYRTQHVVKINNILTNNFCL